MVMSPSARKNKGKTYEAKIANYLHEWFYENHKQYHQLFYDHGHDQIKPKRDSSSGTFSTSTGDIELGLLQKYFPFSVECKHHADLNFSINSLLTGKCKKLIDIFEDQCKPAAAKKDLTALVVFRANRTEDFCMFELTDESLNIFETSKDCILIQNKYIIMLFKDFTAIYGGWYE